MQLNFKPNVSLKHQLLYEKSEAQLRPVRQFDSEIANLARLSLEEILAAKTESMKLPSKLKPIPPITSSSTTVN